MVEKKSMPSLSSLGTSKREHDGQSELNLEESAELLDLCRGFDEGEIFKRFHRVVPRIDNEEEIQTYLLRFMGRGLVNSDSGKWYLMGRGETVLWHYHEIKIALRLERSPDSLIFRIRDNLSIRKTKNAISR
jgi:hypothetical protein